MSSRASSASASVPASRRTASARRPVSSTRDWPSMSRSSVPSSASGERTSSDRYRSARSSRRYFPSAGSSRYAITAVSWRSERTSTGSPCISSLARCVTSGDPPSPTSAPRASLTFVVARAARRRCSRRAHPRRRRPGRAAGCDRPRLPTGPRATYALSTAPRSRNRVAAAAASGTTATSLRTSRPRPRRPLRRPPRTVEASSVRNSSWSNRTRTCSRSHERWRRSAAEKSTSTSFAAAATSRG